MEEDSLNTASTFVKCALDRSPRPGRSRRPPLARTQLQPISRKREQNNLYRGANANESERDEETRARSGVKRERRNTGGRRGARERNHKTNLYPPRPMSPFRFVPSPCRPLPTAPSPTHLLSSCGSDPGGTPGLTPRLAGPQAGFLNFVTFKFKHSHLLRSPPPQRPCLLPMPILSLPSREPFFLSLSLSLLLSLSPSSLILSLVYYVLSFVSLSVCARLCPDDFFLRRKESVSAPTFQ